MTFPVLCDILTLIENGLNLHMKYGRYNLRKKYYKMYILIIYIWLWKLRCESQAHIKSESHFMRVCGLAIYPNQGFRTFACSNPLVIRLFKCRCNNPRRQGNCNIFETGPAMSWLNSNNPRRQGNDNYLLRHRVRIATAVRITSMKPVFVISLKAVELSLQKCFLV